MILGVGIDTVEIGRIFNLLKKFNQSFEKKIFSNYEIENSRKFSDNLILKANFFSKRFAAKEAFAKATGLGIRKKIKFNEISILNDKNGKPEIFLTTELSNFIKKIFNTEDFRIHLSLSDEANIAQSIVIIENK